MTIKINLLSTLQFSSPLTISLPCVLPHVGEVDESSPLLELEGIQSILNNIRKNIFFLNLLPKHISVIERHDCINNYIAHNIEKHINSLSIKIRVFLLL
jgi:hypothetical protein